MVRAPGRVTPWPRGVVGERGGGMAKGGAALGGQEGETVVHGQ